MTVNIGLGPNFPLAVGWVGLSQSADVLGWIGSHNMDPWTTLRRTHRTSLVASTFDADRRIVDPWATQAMENSDEYTALHSLLMRLSYPPIVPREISAV